MKKSDLKFLVVGAGAIGGITSALLKKNGMDVPFSVNDVIVNLIHQIENKKREITISNFNDPFFDRFN
jgi:ketopantoate reductase